MEIKEAVETCLKKKYADFSGRASRSEFWWFYLTFAIVNVVVGGILASLLGIVGAILSAVLSLALLAPTCAVMARRAHDRNMPTLLAVPLAVAIVLNVVYLFIPVGLIMGLIGLAALANLVVLILCIFEGTKGSNQYGPDPVTPVAETFA